MIKIIFKLFIAVILMLVLSSCSSGIKIAQEEMSPSVQKIIKSDSLSCSDKIFILKAMQDYRLGFARRDN